MRIALIALAVATFAWLAWSAADRTAGSQAIEATEVRVLATGSGWVRLPLERSSERRGAWALAWPEGSGRVGRVLAVNDAGVVREFRPDSGVPPIGTPVRWRRVPWYAALLERLRASPGTSAPRPS